MSHSKGSKLLGSSLEVRPFWIIEYESKKCGFAEGYDCLKCCCAVVSQRKYAK